jgi:hypothetical protein
MVAVLAVPILAYPEALYRWADGDAADTAAAGWLDPEFFVVRSIIYLAIWIAIASLAKRRRYSGMASAIGLVILTPACRCRPRLAGLARAGVDLRSLWAGLCGEPAACRHEPRPLVTLIRPGHPAMLQVESLRTALLALALLTAWTWFSQFLIVWMADLPPESAWYLGRAGPWLVIQAIAMPAC